MSKEYSLSSTVILIDETGQNRGTMISSEAHRLAQEASLDLVEINKQSGTSVCKIMDRGKWLYERKKKTKHRVHTKVLKEMKFRVNIDKHDLDTKTNHIKKFLIKGHSVRVVVELRGREKDSPALAVDKMNEVLLSLERLAKVDAIKKSTGKKNLISTTVHPLKIEKGKNAKRTDYSIDEQKEGLAETAT